MTTSHKISVIVLLLSSITFFVICTGILAIKEKEKNTRIRLEGELAQTQEELAQTKEALSEANQQIADLSDQLADEKAKAEELAEKLAQEKRENEDLRKKLDNLEYKIEELEEQIEKKDSELAAARKEKEQLNLKIARLEEEKARLQEKLNKLEDTVDLGKISVVALKEIKGMVMAVNEDYGFVIINLGAKDKITKGMVLFVYRDDTMIGKVEVDRIYEEMSSANILPEWKQADIKVGDQVKAL